MDGQRAGAEGGTGANAHRPRTGIGRRRVLALAAGTGALITAGRTAGLAHADRDEPLVGSWMVVGTPPGGPQRILASFLPGGVLIRTAPFQQAAPSGLGVAKIFISTTHGAWNRTSDTEFGLTISGFAFDEAGRFLATQCIRAVLEVNDAGDEFNGAAMTDFVGADSTLLASVSATVRGSRIAVEAPTLSFTQDRLALRPKPGQRAFRTESEKLSAIHCPSGMPTRTSWPSTFTTTTASGIASPHPDGL